MMPPVHHSSHRNTSLRLEPPGGLDLQQQWAMIERIESGEPGRRRAGTAPREHVAELQAAEALRRRAEPCPGGALPHRGDQRESAARSRASTRPGVDSLGVPLTSRGERLRDSIEQGVPRWAPSARSSDEAPPRLTTLQGAFQSAATQEEARHTSFRRLNRDGATFGARELLGAPPARLEEKAKGRDPDAGSGRFHRTDSRWSPQGRSHASRRLRGCAGDPDDATAAHPRRRQRHAQPQLLVRLLQQAGRRARNSPQRIGSASSSPTRTTADVVPPRRRDSPSSTASPSSSRLKSDPGLTHVPVIMFSAVYDSRRHEFIEIGADVPAQAFRCGAAGARIAGLTEKRLYDLEREQVRGAFSRFVPGHVVDELLARTDADLRLAGQPNIGTIMFTISAGFATFTEPRRRGSSSRS